MGHLQTIESEFRRVLADGDSEAVVAWVKERVLESYRNGQAARTAGARPVAGSPAKAKQPAQRSAPGNLPV
jgi:hypothetical protein